MAADALTAFLQCDFDRSDQALLSLTSDSSSDLHNVKKLTDDPRIKHNALVAKFYATRNQEDLDNLIYYVSEFLPAERLPRTTEQFFDLTLSDPAALKFLYTHVGPVALYNVAVIAYHQGFIQPAAAVGELLYSNVEAMDDWLALKTCFLLIDVHLRLGDVSSASTVAAYAEKLLPCFTKSPSTAENPNPQPQSEMKRLAPDWSGRSKGILEAPISYEDAKFCMHIYNARLSAASEASLDGARSIRKEAKSAVLAADDTETRPTAAALLVKARVEQSYSKGLRILASIVNQSPAHITTKVRPLALNSLGVLHHRLGRHALAACYFEHSRQAFHQLFKEDAASSSPRSVGLNVLSSAKDAHVSFNLALQYMKLSDYSRALDLFTICVRHDTTFAKDSALLWIRMAECCVGIETNGNGRHILALEGQGRGRRMIMRSDGRDEGLTLEYAATCARAAIVILDRHKGLGSAFGNNGAMQSERYSFIPNSTSRSGKGDENDITARSADDDLRLRGAALAILAYASLSFDPRAVLEACDELHKLYPKGDSDRCILSRLYAAEAYCMLGQSEEAARRLQPLIGANFAPDMPLREAACINMAFVHLSNGDIATASRAAKIALKAFSTNQKRNRILRKEAIFAVSYIFLRSGETETARRCLRSLLHPSR